MITTITASVADLDDAKVAVEQIKAQLGPLDALHKHTVGILACHYEFVYSGVVAAICNALPFEIMGTISSAQSVQGEAEALLLTLMVLTSDDVEFVTAVTPSLMVDPGQAIRDTYLSACREDKPALVFTFAPFMPQNSGDAYVEVLTEASGGVPCFGTLAVDDTLDFANCFMLYHGEHYREQMAMILVYGEVQPKFYVANISQSHIFEKSALVTKSAGPVLMEVNDRPVIEFFEDLGLVEASETQYALSSLPFLLDYKDGTPFVSKIFVMLTPEKYALCAGSMPEGSTLHIARTDKHDVMLTTGQAMDALLADIEGASGLLIYSCISRSMALGADAYGEMGLVDQKVEGRLPFLMAYSGGEICPTQVSGGKAINRFHNNAFIACVF